MADQLPPDAFDALESLDSARINNQIMGDQHQQQILQDSQAMGLSQPISPPTIPATPIPAPVIPAVQIPSDLALADQVAQNGTLGDAIGAIGAHAANLFTNNDTLETPTGAISRGMPPGQIVKDAVTPTTGDQPVGDLGLYQGKGADLLEASPITVQGQKTGEQKTLLPSPALTAFDQAQNNLSSLAQHADTLAQQNKIVEDKLNEIAKPFDEQRAALAAETATAIRAEKMQAQADYDKSRQNVENLRQQMSSQDWTSYWGSKSTGDKLLLGLAVGLGAYGQSQVGGQNVALALINSQIQDFQTTRMDKMNSLRAQYNEASADSLHILQGAKQLNELEMASQLADLDQINKQYDLMASKAKTDATKIKIQMESDKTKAAIFEKQASVNAQLAGQAIRTEELFAGAKTMTYDPSSYKVMNAKGQLEPMSTEQGKYNTRAIGQLRNYKNMEILEAQKVLEDPIYAQAFDVAMKSTAGAVAEGLDAVQARTRLGTDLTDITHNNPALYQYMIEAVDMAQQQTRLESGAAIQSSELGKNLQNILPPPARLMGGLDNQRELLKSSHAKRRDLIRGNLSQAGNQAKPYFDANPGVNK